MLNEPKWRNPTGRFRNSGDLPQRKSDKTPMPGPKLKQGSKRSDGPMQRPGNVLHCLARQPQPGQAWKNALDE
jgi:hypothetical protein